MKPRTKKIVIILAVVLLAAFAAAGMRRTSARTEPQSKAKATLSVTTTGPEKKIWPLQLVASGAIVAWQEAIIGAETGGLRITALHADVGTRVKQGQVLADLARESVQAELRRYEASLASARANLAQAKANADRARLVKDSGAISDQQFNEYLVAEQTAKANMDLAEAQLDVQKVVLSQTRIVAVDEGTITARSVVLGQVVASGMELFRLQRQDRLEWQAEVDANQLTMIKAGANAEVTLPSGKVLHGIVRLVAPTLSTATSRANVFVSLPGESGAKAGMFASGRIEPGRQTVLTVPESALVLRDGHSYLFEVNADNKVIRRTVTVGVHREGLVEIAGGLGERARIVTAGGAFLADGDLVNVTKEEGNQVR
jgi:RND family efflux transporter MFP subunit